MNSLLGSRLVPSSCLLLTTIWLCGVPNLMARAQVPPKAVSTRIVETTRAGLDLSTRTVQITEPTTNITTTSITGGTRPNGGTNLFHSFDFFTVGSKDIAHFQNNTMLPTTNIIARVIGDAAGLRAASTIDGILRTNNPLNAADPLNFGAANLYLVNPAGIIFGQNAQLDIKGSFAATTADYLRMTDGGIFHADPVQPSVLSVASVNAFGFTNPRPVAISIQNTGNLGEPPLSVATGQTISVIGGNIDIVSQDNGIGTTLEVALNAPGGRINLASVASTGEVVLNAPGEVPDLDVHSLSQLGSIAIRNDTSINLTGDPGGTLIARAGSFVLEQSQISAANQGLADHPGTAVDIRVTGDITLRGGSLSAAEIGTSSFGGGNAGKVRIEADTVQLSGGANINQNANIGSRSFSTAVNAGDGNAIDIMADRVLLGNNAFIQTRTFGPGNAGNINLVTDSLEARGTQSFIDVSTRGSGNGGILQVTADQVQLLDGGFLTGSTFGASGRGGSIDVATNTLTISGRDSFGNPSGIFSNTSTPATGNAGNIRIVTAGDLNLSNFGRISVFSGTLGNAGGIDLSIGGNLTATNGGFITSSNFGAGAAGDVNVTAKNILLKGPTAPALAFTTPGIFTIGGVQATRAGNLTVKTGNLDILEGAMVIARTNGPGPGGTIDVTADQVTIGGSDPSLAMPEGTASGIYAGTRILNPTVPIFVQLATGNAGNINIRSGLVELMNRGTIEALSDSAGNGGNITVTTPSLNLASNAMITAQARRGGNAGNINLNVGSLVAQSAAQITSSSAGTATGNAGSVIIQGLNGTGHSAQLVSLTGANTFISSDTDNTGRGGDIEISAGQVQLADLAAVNVETSGRGEAGSISVASDSLGITSGARIEASTRGVGNAGDITITNADTVSVSGLSGDGSTRSGIFAKTQTSGVTAGGGSGGGGSGGGSGSGGGGGLTSTAGNAGDIGITTNNLLLSAGAQVDSSTATAGSGGSVTVNADAITITGTSTRLTSDASRGNGTGGDIALTARTIRIHDKASVTAATDGTGSAGNISMTANESFTLDSGATVTTSTRGSGKGGTILINAPQVLVDGLGTSITADTLRPFADLAVILNILHPNDGDLTVRLDSPDGTRVALLSRVGGSGDNFTLTIFDDQATQAITSASAPFTGTFKPREPLAQLIDQIAAGTWKLNVNDQAPTNTGSLQSWSLRVGDQVFQSTNVPRNIPDNGSVSSNLAISVPARTVVQGVGEAPGVGGDITINAGTVTVQNGATLSATTRGSGQGGTLTVNATGPVALAGSGSGLFTDSEASGAGGNLNVTAGQMTMSNGATVSAASSGTGDAGTLTIRAGSQFLSTNSAVTTEATQASGGNISLFASDMIWLRDSTISASVFGGPLSAGGNILIDPQFVILQNSQIIAQAFQGAGGNISIVANTFLPDASSIVSASSQFGLSGTVSITSPTQALSGALVPLRQDYLRSASLIGQRCAARAAEGQVSSFLVTEREGLPQEPGGMLMSGLVDETGSSGAPNAETHSTLLALANQPFIFQIAGQACRR